MQTPILTTSHGALIKLTLLSVSVLMNAGQSSIILYIQMNKGNRLAAGQEDSKFK